MIHLDKFKKTGRSKKWKNVECGFLAVTFLKNFWIRSQFFRNNALKQIHYGYIYVHAKIQKRAMLFDQKEIAKSLSPSRFHVRSFSLLPGWREGWSKKKTPESLDHTRTALKSDRSIDREEHATISTLDLLALVQLGEICENVCATIGSGPTLRFHRHGRLLVSNRVSIKNECSCHERLHRCSSLSITKTRCLRILSCIKDLQAE